MIQLYLSCSLDNTNKQWKKAQETEEYGTIDDLNVKQIISLVGNQYKRVDIRAILARPKEETESAWTCVFLKVRMTNENQDELENSQHNSSRLGHINTPFFAIKFMNHGIDELDSILKDIASGYVSFGDTTAKLPSTRSKDILSNTSSVSDMYTIDDEKAGNIHLLIFTTMELSIAGQIQKLGLTQDHIGIKVSELHTWLNTTVLDDGQINNVVLLLPIYCRQVKLTKNERNDALTNYEIHSALLDKCSAKLKDGKKGDILKIFQHNNFEHVQKTHNDMLLISLPPVDKSILMERPLRVQIWHDDLGLIREDNVDASYLVETPFDGSGGLKDNGPFHVYVETSDQEKHPRRWIYETNLTRRQVLRDFVIPLHRNNKRIICNGESFGSGEIAILRVYYTSSNLEGGVGFKDQLRLDQIMHQEGTDVTRLFHEESELDVDRLFAMNSKQVFIVHGHDTQAKFELARMVEKEFRLEAIILDEQADRGRTLIEKFEHTAELPGYAFVLLTPDDIGKKNTQQADPNRISEPTDLELRPRARQNVIFELGYFFAKLGRERVCCLYKSGVEIPSDISGLIYKEFRTSVREKEGEIRRELRALGYDV